MYKQVQKPRTRSYRDKPFFLYITSIYVPNVCGISVLFTDL